MDWPGALSLFDGGGVLAVIEAASYALGIALALWIVARDRTVPLRADAAKISDFNMFLVRACFFVVLFVGLGDAIISALRVENVLDVIVGEQLNRDLGRSQFRGPWVHVPLMILGVVAAFFVRTLGFPLAHAADRWRRTAHRHHALHLLLRAGVHG